MKKSKEITFQGQTFKLEKPKTKNVLKIIKEEYWVINAQGDAFMYLYRIKRSKVFTASWIQAGEMQTAPDPGEAALKLLGVASNFISGIRETEEEVE